MKIATPILMAFLTVGIVGASYLVFQGSASMPQAAKSVSQPSMVPGAEAVRPLAASQSVRADEILSELVAPPPAAQGNLPDLNKQEPGPIEPSE